MMEAIDDFITTKFQDFQYLKFTIGVSLVNFCIEFYINLRQRSRLQETSMPQAVADLGTTQKQFEESNAYAFDKMNYGLIRGIYGLIKELCFLVYFFYPAMWRFTDEFMTNMGYGFATHPILCQLAYAAVSDIFDTVIGIPWSLYYDFVIEEKWGFNKKTAYIFFTDMLKNLAIGIPLNCILFAVILKLINWAGDLWFIPVWLFICVFMFVMMWIYPTFIQPCFNKCEELEISDETKEGKTRAAIEALAERIDYPLKQLYKIDGSKRSGHSNAYMYGFCSNKRIVLFDTLMDQMNIEQITAVLGHELGHWSHSHTVIMLVKMQITLFIGFFFTGFFLKDENMYKQFGFDEKITLIGIMLAMGLFAPLSSISKFLNNYHTRVMEYQADRFAVNLGYAEPLKEGLKILVGKNKKDMNPDWLYATYNYSHPATVERLAQIDAAVAKKAKKSQ